MKLRDVISGHSFSRGFSCAALLAIGLGACNGGPGYAYREPLYPAQRGYSPEGVYRQPVVRTRVATRAVRYPEADYAQRQPAQQVAQPRFAPPGVRPGGEGGASGGGASGGGGGGGGGGGSGGGGSGGGGGGWSDIRLKQNIELIGMTPGGLPLYAFDYVWGGPRQVGVMAQDVQRLRPEAVLTTDSGYLKVDYDRIDTRMMTFEDWKAGR